MKTSELTGHALDFAVAKCIGRGYPYPASTEWAVGGPIIEREGIDLRKQYALNSDTDWTATLEWLDEPRGEGFGPTPLIAAMRAFVSSRLGDEVEIPDEVLA